MDLADPVSPDCAKCDGWGRWCPQHLAEMRDRRRARHSQGLSDIGVDSTGERRCFICAAWTPHWQPANHDCATEETGR